MKAQIDSDVVMDFLLNRPPFITEAVLIWKANRTGQFTGYVCATTITNIFYHARKNIGIAEARKSVDIILGLFEVCPVDKNILKNACLSLITDFEDAVQHAAAVASGVDCIVTRNLGDYKNATLDVFSPAEFLKKLGQP